MPYEAGYVYRFMMEPQPPWHKDKYYWRTVKYRSYLGPFLLEPREKRLLKANMDTEGKGVGWTNPAHLKGTPLYRPSRLRFVD